MSPEAAAGDDPDDMLFDPASVEAEEAGSPSGDEVPWDPAKIRITTKVFSLRDVVDQINDGDLDLAPDFQRDFVWKTRQKTRLVESILLGIPLPAFYFNQDADGKYQVVDGVQRLSTISDFMNDATALDGAELEYLDTLGGAVYSTLDPASVRRFRSTQIVVHVIEPQTPDDVKYDIFNRVNTLGSPLSAQEIRHAMSRQRSRGFLQSLTELAEFDQATEFQFWRRSSDGGEKVRASGRMTNRELVLRYCAFKQYDEADYRSYSSLDAYLVEFTRRLDGNSKSGEAVSDAGLRSLKDSFSLAMRNAHTILGRAAFRRWPTSQARRGPINRAVFEAQSIALSEYDTDTLRPHSDAIVQAFRAAFEDSSYARSVTVGTGDPLAVQKRLTLTREILREATKS